VQTFAKYALLAIVNFYTGITPHTESPSDFKLHQNFPNPFNPSTTIRFDVRTSGNVSLKVFDVLGREVKTLVKEFKTAGYHKAQFTAEGLASGAYFYRFSVSSNAGEFTAVRKCVLVK